MARPEVGRFRRMQKMDRIGKIVALSLWCVGSMTLYHLTGEGRHYLLSQAKFTNQILNAKLDSIHFAHLL